MRHDSDPSSRFGFGMTGSKLTEIASTKLSRLLRMKKHGFVAGILILEGREAVVVFDFQRQIAWCESALHCLVEISCPISTHTRSWAWLYCQYYHADKTTQNRKPVVIASISVSTNALMVGVERLRLLVRKVEYGRSSRDNLRCIFVSNRLLGMQGFSMEGVVATYNASSHEWSRLPETVYRKLRADICESIRCFK